MGKRNRQTHANIKSNAKRCIYCEAAPPSVKITIEHMPPRSVFQKKDRLKGLEFPACEECNVGTKAADAAVAFLARLDQMGDDVNSWKIQEALTYLRSADDGAPGFRAELFEQGKEQRTFMRTSAGVLYPVVKTNTGPIGQSLINVFGAKLGMAIYYEHTSEPLPVTGGVHTMGFLNAGLSEKTALGLLKTLPVFGTLEMGKRSASDQFAYRYNSDDRSIVAALTHFHNNIHFFTIAMAEPERFGFPQKMDFSAFIRPGELLKNMPKPRPAILNSWESSDQFPSVLFPKAD